MAWQRPREFENLEEEARAQIDERLAITFGALPLFTIPRTLYHFLVCCCRHHHRHLQTFTLGRVSWVVREAIVLTSYSD